MEKTQTILDTALRLFSERGIDSTPTALISKEAGVSSGLLFYYFATKEELVTTLFSNILQEFMDVGFTARETPFSTDLESYKDNLRLSVEAQVKWGLANWEKFQFKHQVEISKRWAKMNWIDLPGLEKYRELLNAHTQIGIDNDFIKHTPWVFAYYLGPEMVSAMTEFLHDHPEEIHKAETWDELWDYFWDAIKA